MDVINKHSSLIRIFNILLLAAAFVLELVYLLNNKLSLINTASNVISLCAVIAGLFYIFKDYKKQGAVYYKAYIVLYAASRLLYTMAEYRFCMTWGTSYLSAVLNTIVVFCGICLLIKDLGKKPR